MSEIKTIAASRYHVSYTASFMQIGCQRHEIASWWQFGDDTISRMDRGALEWWCIWKPILQQVIKVESADI